MSQEELTKYMEGMFGKIFSPDTAELFNWNDVINNMGAPQGGNTSTASSSSATSGSLSYELFETHHFIFIRIPIEHNEWLERIRIFHTANELYIENIPGKTDKHTVSLPTMVKRKGTKTQYKEQILEIQLEKVSDHQYAEINVDF